MKIDKYIIAAVICITLVSLSYIANFYLSLSYHISTETAVWGQLGDYFGGLLNPILSFISIVLLIKSLTLQNEANRALREELSDSRKTEKLRSFETHFFNMIASQKDTFDSFYIEFNHKGKSYSKKRIDAVIEIENEIEEMVEVGAKEEQLTDFLKLLDEKDQIFGMTRVFYIMVKMISEKLSDENGFTYEDRKAHYLTLINFTDFSLLRLIMISMQFLDYHSVDFLRKDKEFNLVINEVELSWQLY
jgi:uncharacterized membrane protein